MSLAVEDPNNWTWSPEAKAHWPKAADTWQIFLNHVRNPSLLVSETEPFPYPLSLFPSHANYPKLLPFSGNRLLVRASDHELFRRAWCLREERPDFGIVLTGQPGTGKTTWLHYFLVKLLQLDQVVIFATQGCVFIFYHDAVYSLLETYVDEDTFPQCTKPIWCLINPDGGSVKEPIAALTSAKVFPVMATSPDPHRYRTWKKQHRARILGMPLWSEEELWEGLRLQTEYQSLVDDERTALRGDGAITMDDDEVLTTAIKEKLKSAIISFGTSPRDVYRALFEPDEIRADLYEALQELSYDDILVAKPSQDSIPSKGSHRIICIKPRTSKLLKISDSFHVDFKSEEIMILAQEQLQSLQYDQARKLIGLCRSSPESCSLAGWAFEAFTHNILMANVQDITNRIALPDLVPMAARSSSGRVFSTPDHSSSSLSSPSSSSPSSSDLRFPVQKRRRSYVDFKALALEPPYNDFYIPRAPNNPLFDSFLFSFEEAETTGIAVIWVIQSTISTDHRGSDKGYTHIRAIEKVALEHVTELLRAGERQGHQQPVAKVVVKYVLACPSLPDGVKRTWTMPKGWEQGGNLVCCQHIPVEHPLVAR